MSPSQQATRCAPAAAIGGYRGVGRALRTLRTGAVRAVRVRVLSESVCVRVHVRVREHWRAVERSGRRRFLPRYIPRAVQRGP